MTLIGTAADLERGEVRLAVLGRVVEVHPDLGAGTEPRHRAGPGPAAPPAARSHATTHDGRPAPPPPGPARHPRSPPRSVRTGSASTPPVVAAQSAPPTLTRDARPPPPPAWQHGRRGHRDPRRPVLRHPDPAVRGDAPGHGRCRGRRRAAARRPDGDGAVPRGRRAPRARGRGVPADGDDVQPDRRRHPRRAGRRRDHGAPRPRAALGDRRHRRRVGRRRRHRARRARRVHGRRPGPGARAGQRLPAAADAGVPRADPQLRRRHGVAARRLHRGRRAGPRPRAARPPRRRPPVQRRRRLGCGRRPLGRPGRQRVDRLHQGPRRAARRRAGRADRLHRAGVAVEAPPRRGDAPGRDRRRGVPLRPRQQRRAARRRPRARRRRWPPGSPSSASPWNRSSRTWSGRHRRRSG